MKDVTQQRRVRHQAQDPQDRNGRIATIVQHGLLPTAPDRVGDLRVATRYRSAGEGEIVGGDWYDLFPLQNGQIALTVGDVAGHGVQAAVAMARLRFAARLLTSDGARPAQLVGRLNQVMHECDDLGGDVEIATVVHAHLDPSRHRIVYCNAGHLPLYVLTPNGAAASGQFRPAPGPGQGHVRSDRAGGWLIHPLGMLGGPPIGVVPGLQYRHHHTALPPGATLIGFTDGLIENRHQPIDQALRQFLTRLQGMPTSIAGDAELIADTIMSTRPADEQSDDVAVIVLALHG